jgi:hypothetical protein
MLFIQREDLLKKGISESAVFVIHAQMCDQATTSVALQFPLHCRGFCVNASGYYELQCRDSDTLSYALPIIPAAHLLVYSICAILEYLIVLSNVLSNLLVIYDWPPKSMLCLVVHADA